MKSRVLNFRIKEDEYKRLSRFANRYDMTPTKFIQRFARALVSEQSESEALVKSVLSQLSKKHEDYSLLVTMIADTTQRLESSVNQEALKLNGDK